MKKIFAILIVAVLILTSGCNESPGKSDSSKPDHITIAIQNLANDELIAKSWYEEAFGTKVYILSYDSSLLINSAMATENIDIAMLGTVTAAMGISKDYPYEIFWIHNVEDRNEALIAKNSSGIESIEDLKGKRIAVTFGATTHYSLMKALELEKIDVENDVKIINMQPTEILNAWNDDKIDAAYIWNPTLKKLSSDGKILITGRQLSEKGIVTADVAVVNKDFAKKYPNIVKKYIELQTRATALFINNTRAAGKIVANELKISESDAIDSMEELIWIPLTDQISPRYMGTSDQKGHLVDTLKETADFLKDNGVLENVSDREIYAEAVNPKFAEEVANNK